MKRTIFFLLAFFLGPSAWAGGLVGAARIPSDARDGLGDTLGGFGSAMALVPGSWHADKTGFTAILAMLPDRGWNSHGTSDYRARLQFFDLELTPGDGAPGIQTGLRLTLRRTLLLRDVQGLAFTGLDPDSVRPAAAGLPDLPAARDHVSLDGEALAFAPDGSFWVGDEYGPYIYHFDAQGKMTGAIRPPEALIPRRDGKEKFSAGENAPGEPQSGRQNNQGLEGISIAPDGKHLFAMTQSALVQDLDPTDRSNSRRNTRLLEYDISGGPPRLIHESAVQLPLYDDGQKRGIAAQSELLAIDSHQLLLLCRDSGSGFTAKRDASAYRRIDLVDIAAASDFAGRYDGAAGAIAPKGQLRAGIRPASPTLFLDINDNSQLARFGLHNGAPNDSNDLYEKWESMALSPDGAFLLVASDNDFNTRHGMMAGKPYSGDADVDSLVLAYRVALPPGSR